MCFEGCWLRISWWRKPRKAARRGRQEHRHEHRSEEGRTRVSIAVVGAPNGAKWEIVKAGSQLRVCLRSGQRAFKVVYWKGTQRIRQSSSTRSCGNEGRRSSSSTPRAGRRIGRNRHETGEVGVPAGSAGPYVVDNAHGALENPYKSWMRSAGFDFFSDGRGAFCTWSGDVWIVSGIDDEAREAQVEAVRDRPVPAARPEDRRRRRSTSSAATRSRGCTT